MGAGRKKLVVEIKKWAQQANLGALINQIKQLPGAGLLVADYVNPNMADTFREQGVQFIDTVGNAFIDQAPVYIFVKGHREELDYLPNQGGAKRAFEPRGLVVTYAFLCEPELMNAPYREIVKHTGVAMGTVVEVLKALKEGGFIREDNHKKRHFTHYRKLLNRWIEVWPEKLKPKYFVGAFVAEDANWWKKIKLANYGGYWGGEVAASKFTGYLNPQVATIYMHDQKRVNFLKDARLQKLTEWREEKTGTLLLYTPFWPQVADWGKTRDTIDLVDPLLVYADLIATADPRNMEVAEMIYDEYIAQHCREDRL